MQSTGKASRGLAGAPGIGGGNYFLDPARKPRPKSSPTSKSGLYVTETMGFGVNLVTGDYSHGASGLWIENGELAYAVEEITIAGNLKDMSATSPPSATISSSAAPAPSPRSASKA